VVCRINDLPKDQDQISEFIRDINEDCVCLAYFSAKEQVEFNHDWKELFDIKLVDRKVTYSKYLHSEVSQQENISSYSKDFVEDKLLALSIESGKYSRFKVDSRIENQKFEDLYTHWITNSVSGKLAEEVLIYKTENEIAGILTLQVIDHKAHIGIIAVDAHFRGQGIGKSLLKAAEFWFSEKGFDKLHVVTQLDNVAACGLYEHSGYSKEKLNWFYHLWVK
jgi:dTDP-4-amino-4,6-dideoxy-D-galactose acyltransferase